MALVSLAGVAVRVEHEGDADNERSKHERPKLAQGVSQTLPVGGRGKGFRQQLCEADEDKGSSAQQEDDRDLEVRELVTKRQDEHRAHDGGNSGHQVPGKRLGAIRTDGQQGNISGLGFGTKDMKCGVYPRTLYDKTKEGRTEVTMQHAALRRELWRIIRGRRWAMAKKGTTLM